MMNINTIHVALIGAAVTAVAGLVFVANAQTRVQSLPPALAPAGCLPGMIPTPGWSERTPPIHADRWWPTATRVGRSATYTFKPIRSSTAACRKTSNRGCPCAHCRVEPPGRLAAFRLLLSQPASQPASKARPGEGGRLLTRSAREQRRVLRSHHRWRPACAVRHVWTAPGAHFGTHFPFHNSCGGRHNGSNVPHLPSGILCTSAQWAFWDALPVPEFVR